jgi:hypothetical protein
VRPGSPTIETLARPSVHLNGTSRDALVDGFCTAGAAVRKAIEALSEHAAPNGRDYYTQGNGAMKLAQLQHAARLAKLGEVLAELQLIAEAIG